MKFHSVAIVVRDEKKAMKWYHEKLGFRIVTRWRGWVTVAPPGANVRLHLCPDSKPEKGNTGILFTVKDAKKTERALREKGVKITMPAKKESWGTNVMFADPDGNEFWLLSD